MGKIFGFLICLILSLGIFFLSLIQDNLTCVKADNSCKYESQIAFFNFKFNETNFESSDLRAVYCEKRLQPSKSHKKSYYTLTVNIKNEPYVLESFSNYRMCSVRADEIKNFEKSEEPFLNFKSGFGFSNMLGMILGFILFVISILVITDKEKVEPSEEDC